MAVRARIELGPLSPEDVRAMAGPDLDLSAADGVPLFVEELLKSIEDGEDSAALSPRRFRAC